MKKVGVFAATRHEFETYQRDVPHRKCFWFNDEESMLAVEVNMLTTLDTFRCIDHYGRERFERMRELGRTRVRN